MSETTGVSLPCFACGQPVASPISRWFNGHVFHLQCQPSQAEFDADELAALRADVITLRAAIAERQAAIDELCLLSELLVMGDPQVAKRKAAGWSTARALATKEPQS